MRAARYGAGAVAVAALAWTAPPAVGRAAGAEPAPCAPAGELRFVCGAERPEDLARIPGTKWLIASGFAPGPGLKLVDAEAKTLRPWYAGARDQVRPDAKAYPACAAPPDPKSFNVQGIALRPDGSGRYRLYAANHGGREAIEVFAVDARAAEPTLAWLGCAPMPEGYAANSVAPAPGGVILATVLTRPGTTIADFVQGRVTGGVFEWRPGDAAFRLLPGTELPGNNGLEVSRDGRTIYVVAFGWHAVVAFSRDEPTAPPRRSVAPGFMPDNIHWDGDRLIAAGMTYDEPACGGLRKVVDGKADEMRCHRGYVVAEVDPQTLAFRTLAYAEPNTAFNGVSSAVVVGDTLWLASYQADRLAYRPLPGGPPPP